MRLSDVDLNLLVTLQVLLQERNVTRAAVRLGRTQSATSHALGRLREMFDDPLLIRGQGGMLPTPRAEALEPELKPLLRQIQRLLHSDKSFDAATTQRSFSIACPDAIGGALTTLLQWINRDAPHAHLNLRRVPPGAIDRLESGELDLLITATSQIDGSDVIQRRLGTTRFVSFVREEHPLLSEPVALESWLQTPHIQVHTGDRSPNILGSILKQQGLERRLGVSVPNFMMALAAVVATDGVFTAPDVMESYACSVFGVQTVVPPLALPLVTVGMFWHRRWHQDPGHIWFRDGVREALEPLAS